jgi:hypothetical protein
MRNEATWRVAPTPIRLPRLDVAPVAMLPADSGEDIPPVSERWISSPAAAPVASFVRAAAALTPVAPRKRFAPVLELPLGRRGPAPARACPAPPAEPVADYVCPAAALTPLDMAPAHRSAHPLQMPSRARTLPLAGRLQDSAAEPVAMLVRTATDVTPWATPSAPCVPAELAFPVPGGLVAVAGPLAAPAAEPVAQFVLPAVVLNMIAGAAVLRQPQPNLAAVIEAFPDADEFLEPPAICLRAMPSPPAEPVCRFVGSTAHPFLIPALSCAAPRFSLAIEVTHVPYIAALKPASPAEPVMMPVYARAADVVPAPGVAAGLALPQIPSLEPELLALAIPAPNLPAEPAESLLVTAKSAIPMLTASVACQAPGSAALVLANRQASPALEGPAAGLQPCPVESLVAPVLAATRPAAITMRTLEFTIRASEDLMAPGFDLPRLAPGASQPRSGSPTVVTLHPIATLSVSAPQPGSQRLQPTMPQPGMLPLEFHAQRGRGVPFSRPDWQSPSLTPLRPGLKLRPVFEKQDAVPAPPKPSRQDPDFVKTFPMPAARKPSAVFLFFGRIAAGLLVATTFWAAYSGFRGDHHLRTGADVAAVESALPSYSLPARSAGASSGAGPSAPAPKGPVAWVRQNIAKRASIQATETFRGGLQNWSSSGKGDPAGWARQPEGYINTGALALFLPSLRFKDYRFEFAGQIETRGMSWSVRAKDSRNYHAMKVTLLETGLRPFVALLHWDVIDGKAGRQLRTPLNIMVHNNRPMQVAINVAGNRLVTSIDGEEVDSFTNNTLASGGVGFFSEASDRARLYWMKVTANDDWLGHVCAFLAGDDAVRATAELRGPATPGGAPSPWTPGEESTTFAAAWAALPYLRAARRARASYTRRTDQWNM